MKRVKMKRKYFGLIVIVIIISISLNVKAEAYLESSNGGFVFSVDDDNYINKINIASGHNISFTINGTTNRFSWGSGEDSVLLVDEKVSYIKVNISTSNGVSCRVSNNKSSYYDFSNNTFTLKDDSMHETNFPDIIGSINCSFPTTDTFMKLSTGNFLNISLDYIDKDVVKESDNESKGSKSYKYLFGVINQNYINSLNNQSSITSVLFDDVAYENGEDTIHDTDKPSINLKIQQNALASKNKIKLTYGTERSTIDETYSGPKNIPLEYGLNGVIISEETERSLFISSIEYDGDNIIDDVGFLDGTFSNYNPALRYLFNRLDTRSKVNTLKSLTISNLAINFNPDLKTYMGTVPYKVSSVKINSSLTDIKSSYVPGFGNRNVNLNEGMNDVLVKVKAENGDEAVYTIKINRELNDDASLRNIKVNDKDITIKNGVLKYSVQVDNEIVNPTVIIEATDAKAKIEKDEIKDLQEGSNTFNITVTASNGNKLVYVLDIIRDTLVSTNSKLKNIIIKNHDFKFNGDKEEFDVHITSEEEKLDLEIIPENEKAKYVVIGNKNLKNGSQIKIKVTAEDEETISNYTINITKDSKKINILFIIIPSFIILIGICIVFITKKKAKKEKIQSEIVNDIPKAQNDSMEKETVETNVSNDMIEFEPIKKSNQNEESVKEIE